MMATDGFLDPFENRKKIKKGVHFPDDNISQGFASNAGFLAELQEKI